MTERVTASVVGAFPAPSSAGGPLLIEPDVGIYNDDAVHLLLYPPSGVRVFPSVGTLSVGDVKQVTVPSGFVTISGRTGSLPRPTAGGLAVGGGQGVLGGGQFQVVLAVGTDGLPMVVSVTYDAAANVLVTSQEVSTAIVKYESYTSIARRLAYRPGTRTLPAGGIAADFGAICAFRAPSTTLVYPVTPFDIINGNAVYELYRIVSDAVSTPEGEFEKPTNYPTNPGTYTGSGFTLDVSVSMQTERVHEIGYMDESGRGWANAYFVSARAPFVGDISYTIPKRSSLATVTQYPRHLQQRALDFIASRGLGPR